MASEPALPNFAPNQVDVSDTLITSGRPAPEVISDVGRWRLHAVVLLGTPPEIAQSEFERSELERQEVLFFSVPMQVSAPERKDFEALASILESLKGRKVLVHCRANAVASSMVFLYRVIRLRVPPDVAYDAVSRVWAPTADWLAFMGDMLRDHGLHFTVE